MQLPTIPAVRTVTHFLVMDGVPALNSSKTPEVAVYSRGIGMKMRGPVVILMG
jgi:hypothetical protein